MDLYQDQLRKPNTSVVDCDFDAYFDQQLKELEGSTDNNFQRAPQLVLDDVTLPSSSDTGVDEPPPPIPGLLPGRRMNIILIKLRN